MSAPLLNIAARVPKTEAEGPGNRFALWVQGCPFRCPGCCNPHYLESRPAEEAPPGAILEEVLEVRDQIEGITLIGGEPFAQAEGLGELAREVQRASLSVMVFTGYRLEQLQDPSHRDYAKRQKLLAHTDLLVDGLYRQDLPDRERRWIGSTNQSIHFLTNHYEHLKKDWPRQGNTLEIRMVNGQITFNGFPHAEITRMSASLIQGNDD